MKIFISSVRTGLELERKSVTDTVLKLHHEPIGMEYFSASPDPPLEECLSRVEDADLFILILGPAYGSVHPGTGVSYTENEYRHARKLGLDVIAFPIEGLDDKIGEANPRDVAEAYKKFLSEVKASATYDAFPNAQTLATAVAIAVHNHEHRKGELGRIYNLFVTVQEYFAAQLDPKIYVNHAWRLVGRQSTLRELEEFVAGNQKVALLYGPGGIGKSKVLYEFSNSFDEKRTGWNLRFVKHSIPWHADAPRGLSASPCVIVVDDAHRYADLEAVLGMVQSRQYCDRTKLILVARPSGKTTIESVLFREVDRSKVSVLEALNKLRSDEVGDLALQALDSNTAGYRERLVRVSRDCPLVTVVGGRLIRERKIQPELFPSDEDFTHELMRCFRAEITSALPEPRDAWRKMLSLTAALEPVRPAASEFRDKAAAFLGIDSWELYKMFEVLEKHGLLSRRGGLVAIAPDVLGDIILEDECMTRRGEDTGYAKHVFDKFAPHNARNLLRNISELQWRIDHGTRGPSPQLLDTIWQDILEAFRTGNYAVRIHILEIIESVAALQPDRALELVKEAVALD